MTNYDKIDRIFNSNGGYITRKDINAAKIPSAILSQYVRNNNLIKKCAGFYSKEDWIEDDYFIFQYRYPKLIYSFYAAAYLNKLGDYMPSILEVTSPKNYRPFSFPTHGIILHTDTRSEIYNLGITEIKTMFGNTVKTYDMERTVCDFIKNREKIDSESFVKCINWYKNRSDKNVNNLMKYAEKMKIGDRVSSLMEVILNEY